MDKFDEELEKIKSHKSSEKLSEEFKDNLVKKMDEEYSKNKNDKFKDFSNDFKKKSLSFSQRFAIVFSLFIIISGVAFGKNIVDWAREVFSNQDKSIELAIENGYYQNIDMDYIYHDGVGIKVDYVYSDESCIYLAFNIKTEEEYNDLYLEGIELKNENDEIIYNKDSDECIIETQLKRITKYNNIVLTKFYNEGEFIDLKKLKINILNIALEKDMIQKAIEKQWIFEIDINDRIKTNEIKYAINSKNIIDNYNINLKNYRLKVDLIFKDLELNSTVLKRENIIIEDEEGNKYYCNDLYYLKEKELKVSFPLDTNKNVESLKLTLKFINNEKQEQIVLYLKNENG